MALLGVTMRGATGASVCIAQGLLLYIAGRAGGQRFPPSLMYACPSKRLRGGAAQSRLTVNRIINETYTRCQCCCCLALLGRVPQSHVGVLPHETLSPATGRSGGFVKRLHNNKFTKAAFHAALLMAGEAFDATSLAVPGQHSWARASGNIRQPKH